MKIRRISGHLVVLPLIVTLLFGCTGAPAQLAATDTPTPAPPTATYTPIPPTTTPKPTFTPVPTKTSKPTATEMPCTDMGWSDIDSTLEYFVGEVRNLEKLKSFDVFTMSLSVTYIQGMIDRVEEVQVATCTQQAKDHVTAGMNAFLTYCQSLSSSTLDQAAVEKAKEKLAKEKMIFVQANTELSTLGFKSSNLEYLSNHFSNQP